MRDGPYRSPLEGVRARYNDKRAAALEREARITDALWASLPQKLAARLRRLKELSVPRADTLDEYILAEQRLDELDAALTQAIALAPSIEADQNALPSESPSLQPTLDPLWVPKRADDDLVRFGEKLRTIAERYDPGATVEPVGPVGYAASFTAEGAPFTLLAELELERTITTGEAPSWGEGARTTLATGVPKGMPRLHLAPEMWGHSISKLLRLRTDVEIGDESFDGLFLIDGEPEPVRRLLTRELRAELLRLARYDVPTLVIDKGVAELRWKYELSSEPVFAAVRVLARIRRTPADVRLLRPEERMDQTAESGATSSHVDPTDPSADPDVE